MQEHGGDLEININSNCCRQPRFETFIGPDLEIQFMLGSSVVVQGTMVHAKPSSTAAGGICVETTFYPPSRRGVSPTPSVFEVFVCALGLLMSPKRSQEGRIMSLGALDDFLGGE
ncbi:hypothetical protein RRG08_012945 [Elysia crispata]|uniref:Uncharacterized protein n=1 Tax=Elysia crispata TaxID=231223 RepID=A0AAE1A139_9GAST|nr:hypothetical protein RRG08_012945 [Elysia crispata]